ncbi:Cryptochrome DASH, chloroplastic/mitochondrial [Ananas comosus]|uniref:Cryptochrome DASH n=1 Tax=Ananas comosus TaxID=4615 RepID=A0A199VJJ8_ANACO|nr:Cryptochrome DASH, chloroplastic/mitochondrial [Ananas comosus]
MLHLLSPPHSTPLKSLIFSPVPTPIRFLFRSNLTMSLSSSSIPLSNDRLRPVRCYMVPGLSSEEAEMASDEAFRRYSSPSLKRTGKGVAIVWFRNDLRVLDNEALVRAWATSESVYAHKETCSEELLVEHRVLKRLQQVVLPQSPDQEPINPKLQLIWGTTMYHIDDLPFSIRDLPDVYTQFRKAVESKCLTRSCSKLPLSFGPPPSASLDEIGGWGDIPSLEQLGLEEKKAGMSFVGGESAAIGRVTEYFWKKDKLRVYKETRNGMLGPDYSTKFSSWLASGSLSPRYIYEEVKRYEKQRISNDSTYWVLFELIWRDYFRFLSIKYGNSIFHLGGPRKIVSNWSQDRALFEAWRDGRTGYPIIDANMKELSTTGFMSNRGRQIVCSFLVRDMGIDWRMGAEWFETCLLDYDPASNYGNWTYGAGVGNDPREDRYFSIPKQAKTYDPEGEYVAYWLPELRSLPKERRNFPGNSYTKQIVPLKFDTTYQKKDYSKRERADKMYVR